MAWCKRDISDFFRWNFFFLQKCLNFCMCFSIKKKNILLYRFLAEMLLFCFVVFIVHASIFCLCFSQKQSANQAKKYRGMLYYLIEKHMKIFRHFWRKKKFHLKKSLTSLLHQAIQARPQGLWDQALRRFETWPQRPQGLDMKGRGQERTLDFSLKSNGQKSSKLRMPICLYV